MFVYIVVSEAAPGASRTVHLDIACLFFLKSVLCSQCFVFCLVNMSFFDQEKSRTSAEMFVLAPVGMVVHDRCHTTQPMSQVTGMLAVNAIRLSCETIRLCNVLQQCI